MQQVRICFASINHNDTLWRSEPLNILTKQNVGNNGNAFLMLDSSGKLSIECTLMN